MSNILWLMVGRGGSKGVPQKNLREIGGLSLIGWRARAARRAMAELEREGWPGRLIISTDSNAIAAEASRHGVEVPFIRPASLATDDAKSVDVIRHALMTLADVGETYDTVVLLEPSAPFATQYHLSEAFREYWKHNAHLVVGMKHTEPHSSFIGERPDDQHIAPIVVKMRQYGTDTRRQARKPEWTMNGCIYIFRSEVVLDEKYNWEGDWSIYNGGRKLGYLMDRWHSIEIDTMHDLEMAEYAFAKGHVKLPEKITAWDKFLEKVGVGK